MSKSAFVVVDVPACAALQEVPVPGQVTTVLPVVRTWPRSVAEKRGANERSARAGAAVSAAHVSSATTTAATAPSDRMPRHPKPGEQHPCAL
jgi:hypothetical protein